LPRPSTLKLLRYFKAFSGEITRQSIQSQGLRLDEHGGQGGTRSRGFVLDYVTMRFTGSLQSEKPRTPKARTWKV
jgi:hypothetical protein